MASEFDFFQQWYPVSPIEDLEPDRPTAITLLGLDFVIWKRSGTDTFLAFKDECPHRLAPLSEGYIDANTGRLACSYHGWQFDEAGKCKRIPQLEQPEFLEKNGDNFCVTSFPCQVAKGLVWLWPHAESAEAAAQTVLPLSPYVDTEKGFVWSSVVRDLAYDWQTLVENLADPSHVPFAHHGVQGNRDRGCPVPIDILSSSPELIEVQSQGNFNSTITFQPPCRLEYAISFGEGRQVGLVSYCLPVAPGRSRIVALFPRNFAQRAQKLTPRWVDHLKTRNQVLDGDMFLLHKQEKVLCHGDKTWKTRYTMPATADRMVIEFRNWFDCYGQPGYPWKDLPLLDRTQDASRLRRETLDRYHQHTQICGSCRKTLKQIQQLQLVLVGLFAVVVAIAALLPDASRLWVGLPLVLLGLLSLAGAAWLKYWLEPQFYFVDYIHGER